MLMRQREALALGLGCGGCRRRGLGCAGCAGAGAGRRGLGLGANLVSVTWFNGQVWTFDLDNPEQKKQYEAVLVLKNQIQNRPQEPTTTYIYPSSALTPPQQTQPYVPTYPTAPGGAVPPPADWIPGIKNDWLLWGALGIVALSVLRGGKRRR